MYIEKALDLWAQLMKNEGKNKSVAFIILFIAFYIFLINCYGIFHKTTSISFSFNYLLYNLYMYIYIYIYIYYIYLI